MLCMLEDKMIEGGDRRWQGSQYCRSSRHFNVLVKASKRRRKSSLIVHDQTRLFALDISRLFIAIL